MSQDDGAVYILQESEDEEWVRPTPAWTAIVEAVTGATDLDADRLDDAEAYVDLTALAAALDAGEQLQFSVEGHDVTVGPDGTIDVGD
ncbi:MULTISPECIES: HalOD1 output domain-containing protein [Salinibaculum]|uniref:HalOD1 output domain-containing protein n=1 Tax=Salinibaculum TaxID=2732368 RepID=UPI0030D2D8A5